VILEWDPEKAATNLTKHGVDFHEAGTVLDDSLSTTFPDPAHSLGEQRYITIGSALSGRILVVGAYGPGRGCPSHQREACDPERAKIL